MKTPARSQMRRLAPPLLLFAIWLVPSAAPGAQATQEIQAPAPIAIPATLELGTAASVAYTSLYGAAGALQPVFSATLGTTLSLPNKVPEASAPALDRGKAGFVTRLEAKFSLAVQSGLLPDGSLYRGWFGLGAGLLAGVALPSRPLGSGGMSWQLSVLAGGALTAARYTGTALDFAFPSAQLRMQASFLWKTGMLASVSIPFEFRFRGGGYDVSAGIAAAIGLGGNSGGGAR